MKLSKINGWQDFLELGVATWIIASPFALGFFSQVNASLTLILIGCVCFLIALLGLATENPVDEWINLCLGVLICATPWLFGYTELVVATTNAVICGGVMITLTILAMTHEYHEQRIKQVAGET